MTGLGLLLIISSYFIKNLYRAGGKTLACGQRFGLGSIPVSACGRLVVAHPRSIVFSGFFHHVWPQNANIRAFENAAVSYMSFLYDRRQIVLQIL